MTFEGVYIGWATLYVALNMTEGEICREKINHLILVKRSKMEKRPTILTIYNDEKNCRWKWSKDPSTYSENQKKRVMAQVVQIMVKACFNKHFYKWNGKVKRQSKGAGIGIRGARSLAKICMDKWISSLGSKLEELKVKVWILMKYVDDVLIAVTNLCLGSKFRNGELTCLQAEKEKDKREGRTLERVPMDVL